MATPTQLTQPKTRTAILKAAVELASLHGLQQLSLARLAAAAKMSKSGLFAHFGSKEELQLATIQTAWGIFEGQVLRDPAGEREAERRLGELLERWLVFSERRVFPGGCLFAHQAVEFSTRPGPVNNALTIAVACQIEALEERVAAAQRASGRRGKDPAELAFQLYSIVINADGLSRVQNDPVVFDRARATIRTTLPATNTPDNRRARLPN